MAGHRLPKPLSAVADSFESLSIPLPGFPQPLGIIQNPSLPALPEEDTWAGVADLFIGAGAAPVTRIPVPGSGGLYIELRPLEYDRKAMRWGDYKGSTSTLFFRDRLRGRELRLDFHTIPNKNLQFSWKQWGGQSVHHWNQSRLNTPNAPPVPQAFKISDHTPAQPPSSSRAAVRSRLAPTVYQGAKWFRHAGRVVLIAGLALEAYAIGVSLSRREWRRAGRQAVQGVAGFAGGSLGCKIVGALFAAPFVGTATATSPLAATGPGAAVPGGAALLAGAAGLIGCAVGAAGVGYGAATLAGGAYDLLFEPLPELDSSLIPDDELPGG